MSKLFPIIVEPLENRTTNIVEWMIGNTCNFDCSFCHADFKSGNKRFLSYDTYKQVIDKTINESVGKKVWYKITGGEPTLYPKLIDLLTYIKSTGNFTYIITNGSRTMRYWQELKAANCVDIIAFTYHPEQTSNLREMVDVINLFRDAPTFTSVNITCVPEFFDDAMIAFETFKRECSVNANLQQVNDDLGMDKYTEEQQQILLNNSFVKANLHLKTMPKIPKEYSYHSGEIKYTYNDGTEKTDQAINFIKRKEDDFYGYDCFAGTTNIRIDHETIQRAVCGLGERWSIYDSQVFAKNPLTCTQKSCVCTLDIILPKRHK